MNDKLFTKRHQQKSTKINSNITKLNQERENQQQQKMTQKQKQNKKKEYHPKQNKSEPKRKKTKKKNRRNTTSKKIYLGECVGGYCSCAWLPVPRLKKKKMDITRIFYRFGM